MEVHLHLGIGQEILHLTFEQIARQGQLLEVLLVHEDIAVPIVVQVLHVARLDERALDLLVGAEALVVLVPASMSFISTCM